MATYKVKVVAELLDDEIQFCKSMGWPLPPEYLEASYEVEAISEHEAIKRAPLHPDFPDVAGHMIQITAVQQ